MREISLLVALLITFVKAHFLFAETQNQPLRIIDCNTAGSFHEGIINSSAGFILMETRQRLAAGPCWESLPASPIALISA